MGQLKSRGGRFEKDPELKDKYEETVKTDLAKGFLRELATVEIESTTYCPQWFLPHHPVVIPHSWKN